MLISVYVSSHWVFWSPCIRPWGSLLGREISWPLLSPWICTGEPFWMIWAVAQPQALLSTISVCSGVVPEQQELGLAGHSMAQAGRDLSRFSRPTPLLKQGLIQKVAQGFVWLGFEYLQEWRLHNPSRQPVAAALQTALTVKKCSLVCNILPTDSSL